MDIIVPIKQVPETSNVKMDPVTGTMIRDGVGTVVNPLDLYAIEAALRLKEQHGGSVTVITMGPSPAVKALREALAMGCDEAAFVSDRSFGGADSWATSYTLAQAIKQLRSFDLILCGERATDGDTGQVGPGIAAWLDLPLATYVATLEVTPTPDGDPTAPTLPTPNGDPAAPRAGALRVERLVEDGYQILELPLPALITVVKEIGSPRLPTLRGKKRAKATDIPLYNAQNLPLEPSHIGLKGSPTKVVKVATPKVTRSGTVVRAGDETELEAALDGLLTFLEERGLLPEGGPA